MPEGHDTVVMQEDARFGTVNGRDVVGIPPGLKVGANVRKAGEDVKAGEVLLKPGTVLRPQDLAALASIGMAEVQCFRRLKVGIISTGDEVVRAGAAFGPGQVYDANAPMLSALIGSAGAVPVDLGVLPDTPETVKRQIAEAARKVDAIITSGGASRGEEDHVVSTLDALGKRYLWQLAIKPGRPMSFGQIGDCVMLGLPGNPVAVFVCFLLYVWPMLRRLGGAEWPEPRRYRLPALFAYPRRKAGRREFWRGILKETPRGLAVDKFARDGSGLISGLREADGLLDIAEDVTEVCPGDDVAFLPFAQFGFGGG
jgi:molybdopterin molybdotransferase